MRLGGIRTVFMLGQNGDCRKTVLKRIDSYGAEVDEELHNLYFYQQAARYTISRFQRFYNVDKICLNLYLFM